MMFRPCLYPGSSLGNHLNPVVTNVSIAADSKSFARLSESGGGAKKKRGSGIGGAALSGNSKIEGNEDAVRIFLEVRNN